jgi:ABC-type multidrug transport system fused ATPase/permease subunit
MEHAGFLSRVVFEWVSPLFAKGEAMTEADLYPTLPVETAAALSARIHATWDAELAKPVPSLTRAYIRAFGVEYAWNSVPIIVKTGFVLGQTQLLAALLDELRQTGPAFDATAAYLYALGLVLTGAMAGLLHHHYFIKAWRAGMRWRGAATGLIFEKSLRLRLTSLAAVSAGHVVNLASSDIERMQKGCQFFVYLFLAPVETALTWWLLWREIGVGSAAGMAVLAVFVVLQSWFSKWFGRLRSSAARITDERVKVTGQVIQGARFVKLMGYEPPFARLVAAVRAREIAQVTKASWLRGTNEGIFTVAPILIGAASYFTFWATGGVLTPRTVFTTIALFTFLQIEITKFLPMAIESLAELRITMTRLQRFLLLPEVGASPAAAAAAASAADSSSAEPAAVPTAALPAASTTAPAITITHLTASWHASGKSLAAAAPAAATPAVPPHAAVVATSGGSDAAASHPDTLSDVSLTMPGGALTIVCGPVGSSKSSLLMALLGELEPVAGSVTLGDGSASAGAGGAAVRVSYASQNPFLTTGTVKENILCGAPYDAARYASVLDACCLRHDLALWPQGDDTVIGERGVNCSGGQRARIGLARAAYVDADVYLLDDPLSAVDARVGRLLFDRCIRRLLGGRTRVLVTHQLQHLRWADSIAVMAHGRVALQGSFVDVSAAFAAAASAGALAAAPSAAAAAAAGAAPAAGGGSSGATGTGLLADLGDALRDMMGEFSKEDAGAAGAAEEDEEEDDDDGEQGAPKAAAGESSSSTVADAVAEVAAALAGRHLHRPPPPDPRLVSTPRVASRSNRFGSLRLGAASLRGLLGSSTRRAVSSSPSTTAARPLSASASTVPAKVSDRAGSIIVAESMASGSVAGSAYVRYWSAAGSKLTSLYIFLLLAGGATIFALSSVYLAYWAGLSGAPGGSGTSSSSYFIAVYAGLVGASVLVSWLRSTVFFLVAVQASRRLHDAAFSRVLRAPLSFFDANPAGRILNRLSRDVNLLDDMFPATAFDFLNSFFAVLAVLCVVSAVVPWILIAIAVLLVLFYYLRRVYLATARVVKRLESVSRSPVLSLLTESLGGLAVIRAFGMAPELTQRYRDAADANTAAYFVFLVSSRWLGIRLDGLCIVLLAAAAFSAVAVRDVLSPALVGLSLSYVISLTSGLQWTVRQSVEVENQMVSVGEFLAGRRSGFAGHDDAVLRSVAARVKGCKGRLSLSPTVPLLPTTATCRPPCRARDGVHAAARGGRGRGGRRRGGARRGGRHGGGRHRRAGGGVGAARRRRCRHGAAAARAVARPRRRAV